MAQKNIGRDKAKSLNLLLLFKWNSLVKLPESIPLLGLNIRTTNLSIKAWSYKVDYSWPFLTP
jgi:hypothetical protein